MNSKLTPLSSAATLALAALAALAGSAPAQAQVLLDSTYAMAGSGSGFFYDAPGYPIVLLRSGSYKLTGNLMVPAGVSGVEIAVPGVTLDLNGFAILSTSAGCTRNEAISTVHCPNTLGKVGVELKTGGNTVRNGRISGFETAIQASTADSGGDLFEALLLENSRNGLLAHAGASKSIVRNVRAHKLSDVGFGGQGLLIQGSVASNTGGYGFLLSSSMVIDSFAVNNKIWGFYGGVGRGLAVGRNTAWGNLGGDFHDVNTMGDNLNSSHIRF